MKLFLLAILCTGCVNTAELHVAPTGADTNPGTADKPLATLEKAAAVLAARTPAQRQAGSSVVIHEGNYSLRSSLVLGEAQSGTPTAPVVWRAAGDGPVRITGDIAIPAAAIRPVQDENTLARLPAGNDANLQLLEIRLADLGLDKFPELNVRGMTRSSSPGWPELFQSGAPLPLAAWPNGMGYGGGFKVHPAAVPPMSFSVDAAHAARWKHAMDSFHAAVWFGGHWYWPWADDFLPATAISTNGVVTMAVRHHYGINAGNNSLHVYNLVEEMDQPGEYVIEPVQQRLLVLLATDAAKNLTLSWLGTPLVSFDKASFTRVEGIQFCNCRSSAIDIRASDHLTFEHCAFTGIGETAVNVNSRNTIIRNCRFTHIGATGVELSGGDRATLLHANSLVDHCEFEDFGRLCRTCAPGVRLTGVGNTVAHCLFHHAPHSAILFAGNEHIICDNEIHTVLTETADCGAIYGGRDFAAYGTVISGNWIHGIHGAQRSGIYLDDQLSGITVKGNWVDGPDMGVLVGGGRYNTIASNLLTNCHTPIHSDARGTGWAKKHMPAMLEQLDALPLDKEPWKSRYPMVRQGNMSQPTGTKTSGNVTGESLVINGRQVTVQGTTIRFEKPDAGIQN